MKHKFFSKRGFALFVSLMMCVNALSVTAWAGSFSQLQDLINQGGNVVLEDDYTYETSDGDKDSITVSSSVNLNLNGYTITGSGKDSVIKVENGGNLTLKDEATDSAKTNDDGTKATGTITDGGGTKAWGGAKDNEHDGGGIFVNGGSLTMEGGKITGNTAAWGGGVMVRGGGSFEMTGGEISGNTATSSGGGVYVRDNSKFTMDNDAKISENKAKGTTEGGGGVFVLGNNNAEFIMKNGNISNNTSAASGGGIYMDGGTFNMQNGTISSNTANGNGEGGGIYGKNNAKVTMDNGKIIDNTANSEFGGGGVRVWNATFEMNNGTITGNKAFKNDKTNTLSSGGTSQTTIKGGTVDHQDSIKEVYVPAGYGEIKGNGTCEIVEHSEANHPGVTGEVSVVTAATCTEEGSGTATCPVTGCTGHTVTIPALGHDYTAAVNADGTTTYTCTRCGDSYTEGEPVVTIPDVELPLADLPEETAEIADEEVPLAGLVSLAQLLDALYRYEDSPAVELPEEFPFAEHDYAAAICWGLDNALVLSTEEEPLDPDEIITVALLREVLENFVAYKGVELTVTVDGEDDELVMDLGDRLNAFFQLLDEAAA